MNTLPIILVTADDYLLRHWQAAVAPRPTVPAGLDWQAPAQSCVLIDAVMPGLPALDDPWWQARTDRYRILFTHTVPQDTQAYAALQAGCRGYCHALAPRATLQQILEVISNDGIWTGQALLQRLLTGLQQLPRPSAAPDLLTVLSEREREVALQAARGAANKLIARELGITERTVKAHLSSVFEKLHIKDRVQLTLLVNGIR